MDSEMMVGDKASDDPHVHGPQSAADAFRFKLLKKIDTFPQRLFQPRHSLLSPGWMGWIAPKKVNAIEADIVHLHWICNGYLRIEDLPRLRGPIVWTLHDLWPCTGAEHYVEASTEFKNGYDIAGLNRWASRRKSLAYPKMDRVHFVANSHWTARMARESALLRNYPIEVIHYGLDHSIFRPLGRQAARAELGLTGAKKLIAFGALSSTSDRRKGFSVLLEAIRILAAEGIGANTELLVFGAGKDLSVPKLPVRCHFLDRIRNPSELARIYSAADVMVVPSLEEAFGQTALEAQACGAPVAAFNLGGLPDIVKDRETGYLATAGSAVDLARGILWILEDEARREKLSQASRQLVESAFTLRHSAEKYHALYEKILKMRT
jgi:glycosyltransferase involved in cell wall biosynthesis